MSCEICRPILNGEQFIELEPGHSDYDKMKWSNHNEFHKLMIYPKPYKAHKFYSFRIHYCPFCGEDLNSRQEWRPKITGGSESFMELQAFEQQNLQVFKDISQITAQRKALEKQEKEIKKQLEEAMMEHEIKTIDNEFIKITRVEASETVTVDLKELEEKESETFDELFEDYPIRSLDIKRLEAAEPELYEELVEDYPKVSSRKAHLRFKVK